jgi:hypothetical protein
MEAFNAGLDLANTTFSALLAKLGRGEVCAPKQYEHRDFAVGTALCTIP